ncbi:MAG: heavy metal translocating P-type ATPase, partial [Anaerolineales bacterium]|nr:heavy metal translocating P-type ATPase [Anaerolineales bacterium]
VTHCQPYRPLVNIVENSPISVKFNIARMDCAGARTLERGVCQVKGVESVQVNFTAGTLAMSCWLALPGWATLWLAVFADMGASLIVTLNGIRLLREKSTIVQP